MNDYPLSTKSSKKNHSRPNPSQTRSPLLERSVCQAQPPEPLRKEVYGHILQGEYVFIEIYSEGRVAQTPYPEYITFMGGIVCKRLAAKVTIFLTNLTPRQMEPIRERVGRICPNCRILNILWFERCYQLKTKVPFDDFVLDAEHDFDERSRECSQEVDLAGFLANIGEDAENDFKDYFKSDKRRYFEYLPKNHTRPAVEVFPVKPYDLGPNPDKKVRPKNPNPKKRTSRAFEKKRKEGETKQNNGQKQQEFEEREEREGDGEEAEQEKKQANQEDQPLVIENVVSKYLKMQEFLPEERNEQVNYSSVTIKSKRTTPVVSESKDSRPKHPSATQVVLVDSISKKSIHSAMLNHKDKKHRDTQRFTFSKTGTLYKDITKKDEKSIDKLELEGSISVLSRADPNILPVIVASTAMEQKAREINSEATHPSAITFHILNYGLFSDIAQRISEPADVYFLINPKKPAERALFYALTLQQSSLKVRLTSYRLIEEVISYNRHAKAAQTRTPIKLQRSLLRYTKELLYIVCEQRVKGKRIVFIMSELPWRVQQQVIQAMGGIYVHKDDYLNTSVDLIVSERSFWVQDREAKSLSEQAFWRQVIRLEGEE